MGQIPHSIERKLISSYELRLQYVQYENVPQLKHISQLRFDYDYDTTTTKN